MEESVHFYGQLSHQEMIPVLQRAKAMLVNTEKDNCMVSIVESIAAGTPIVTNSIPFNAEYIKKEQLGIVEDEWGAGESHEIEANNSYYVRNCISYRKRLSSVYCAKQFEKVYEKYFMKMPGEK